MSLETQVRSALGPILAGYSVALYDVHVSDSEPGRQLEVILDGPGGLSLTDCARIHREFIKSTTLDLDQYEIIFTTPGIHRKARFPQDFRFYPEKEFSLSLVGGSQISGIVTIVDEKDQTFRVGDLHSDVLQWRDVVSAGFRLDQ